MLTDGRLLMLAQLHDLRRRLTGLGKRLIAPQLVSYLPCLKHGWHNRRARLQQRQRRVGRTGCGVDDQLRRIIMPTGGKGLEVVIESPPMGS
jgi:hypothetical protein